MTHKDLKKKTEGFTIIEVLIVLAIAGLILLIVFMAVPALQRNSRNTQRKNEVASALGAVSEFVSNNNGKLPVTSGNFNTVFSGSNVDFRAYDATNVSYNYSGTARGAALTISNLEGLVIYNFAKCTPGAQTMEVSGTSSRSVAALYMVETSGAPAQQCVSL